MEKHYGAPYMFPPPVSPFRTTYYDCLVVVDFEATCEDNKNTQEHKPLRTERPEIIQFPAILIDVRNMMVVDTFDSFVKPVENPVLSQFCTNLTGITQSMVDEAATFPKVLRRFERWLKKYGLSNSGNGRTFAIVADGSFDMGHFLYKQTLISKIPFPSYAKRWVNIRTIFSKFYGQRWFSLKSVLDLLGQPFEGRQHNGLDDAKNITKVLMRMIMDGAIISQTEKIVLDAEEQEKNEAKILSDKHAGKYDLATVTSVSAHECIYMMAPNLLYRQPPETDFTPSNIDNKENNFPSMKAASAINYKKGPKQARGKRKHKYVVETNLGGAEGAVSVAQEE